MPTWHLGGDRHRLARAAIAAAKTHTRTFHDITYLVEDALTYPFESGSFDLVAFIAALHHIDAGAGLTRLHDLAAVGGVPAIVGLGRL